MLSVQSERDQLVNHWTNCNYERLRDYAARILLLIKSDEPYSKVGDYFVAPLQGNHFADDLDLPRVFTRIQVVSEA